MTQNASNVAAGDPASARIADAARSAGATSRAAAKGGADPLVRENEGRSKLSTKGLLAAVGSFVIWGVFPLYLKPLHEVSSMQIIAHRVAWACVLVCIWLWLRGDLKELRHALTTRATLGRLTASALLVSINWIAYVWGVGHGHVVETSLGYFINPLANVLLGVIVLRERLNFAQWTSVATATAAVVYLAVATGSPPWIALLIASSFSLYGLIRKLVHVEALQGLAVETLLLMPFALGYLLWCEATGTGALGHSSTLVNTLLVGCGPITAVPLFLFAVGTRLIPYSTVGLLLYIAPSLQLVCGIFLYHEPFGGARALGFELIWLALVIYAADGLWRSRRARS